MRHVKELFWVIVGNTFSILGLLITIKLFTKNLSQVEYGIYYLLLTISIFINQIFFGPLSNGISRYFSISKEENNIQSLISNSLSICRKIIIFIGILYIITLILLSIFHLNKYFFAVSYTILFSIFSGLTTIIYSIQNINRERNLVASFQIIEALSKIALTYILLYKFNQNANTALFSIAISSLFIFIIQLLYLNKYSKELFTEKFHKINNIYTGKIIKYSFPFTIWGLFTWAQISSDRWFLQKFSDASSVAKYAVVFQIGYYPLTIIMGYLVQVITPILFNLAGNGEDCVRKQKSTMLNIKIALSSLVVTLLSFIFILIFHRFISNLLTSPDYISVSKFLPYMILSGGLFATSQILSLDFLTNIRIKQLMFIKISTSILGIMLSFMFISRFKFEGAILSNLSYSALYLIVISLYIYFQKYTLKNNVT